MLRLQNSVGFLLFCTRKKDSRLCYSLLIKLAELEITDDIFVLKRVHPTVTSAEKLFQNLILLMVRNVLNFKLKFIHSSFPSLVIAISLPVYLYASIITLERTLYKAIRRNMLQ